ncbi:MAG: DUF1997 domain-containing protein, partial [Trichodesmium sp. MAG_R02]|nr:DUF1997 domain-containing protein [Trichodesmium sp. MAG_R02]
GNGLLKSVLITIKKRLTHQLLIDYYKWANDEIQVLINRENSPVLSTSSQGL